MHDAPLNLLAINIGNTNTQIGLFQDAKLIKTLVTPSTDTRAIVDGATTLAEEAALEPDARRACIIASVNTKAAEPADRAIKAALDWPGPYVIGRDIDIPMKGRLDPEAMTGHDRTLAALAAFDAMKQAVVVVDAGTAITVDFVDGEGVFHGGAIAPGLRMALHALHEHTDALPDLEFNRPPDSLVFGRNTAQAMTNGVYWGARGLVRMLVERYAEAYDAYPLIVATGGDAHTLFDGDDLIDRVEENLVLRGIAIACRMALAIAEADDAD